MAFAAPDTSPEAGELTLNIVSTVVIMVADSLLKSRTVNLDRRSCDYKDLLPCHAQ